MYALKGERLLEQGKTLEVTTSKINAMCISISLQKPEDQEFYFADNSHAQ